jgi:hypothetical protein
MKTMLLAIILFPTFFWNCSEKKDSPSIRPVKSPSIGIYELILNTAGKYKPDSIELDTTHCQSDFSQRQINYLSEQLRDSVFNKATCFHFITISYKDTLEADKFTFFNRLVFDSLSFIKVTEALETYNKKYFESEVWNRFQYFTTKNELLILGSLFHPQDPLFEQLVIIAETYCRQ